MLCKNPYISALCGFSYSKNYNTKNSICKALKNADPCRYPKRLPARRGRCRRNGHDFFVLQNVNSTLLKTAIFDRCFFAFLSVPRTFELLFHGRNTLLNHVFLINDSVNICLFSKSGNSLIILFNIQKFRAVPAFSRCRCSSFFIYTLTLFLKGGVPPPHELCPYPFPCAIPLQQQRAYAYSYLGYRVLCSRLYRLHHRYRK